MKNLYIKIVTNVCIFIFSCNYAYSQISTKEEPVSFSQKNLIWKDSVIVMPELDMDAIHIEDSIDKVNHRLPRMGYPHHVNFNLENSGEWKTLSNGDRIWHLVLACPGANSIKLYFDKFWLPEDAKLFLYGKNTKSLRGPFTSAKNKKGNRINPSSFYGTGVILDDTIVIEYYEPKNVSGQGVVSISIVGHMYRGFDKSRYYGNNKGLNSSGTCQVNINCSEGWNWQNEKNAVAMFSAISDGFRYGTGALINNTRNNKRPFFLTANHCLEGEDAISNPNCELEFWWHYESPNCDNLETNPDYYVTTEGATVLANDSVLDFALLELDEDPDDNPNIMTYYLGWDNSDNLGWGHVGIHHPKGDIKKISTS